MSVTGALSTRRVFAARDAERLPSRALGKHQVWTLPLVA